MNDSKITALNDYFNNEILLCTKRADSLIADARADEAVFEKVRANIYDIFRTVFSAAVRSKEGDMQAVREFFLAKLEEIPANWSSSYDAAVLHHDEVRMNTETIKLETARAIKKNFLQIWD